MRIVEPFLLTLLFQCCINTFVSTQTTLLGLDSSRKVITTTVPFLTISPDARSAAMGDVGCAISADVNSTYWNGSKLAFIDNGKYC